MLGFILGTLVGQFAGAWTYRTAKRSFRIPESAAAAASGLTTAIIASVIYIPLHVQDWLGGEGSSWGVSVFLGLCMGLVQGVLFRGRPLEPRA